MSVPKRIGLILLIVLGAAFLLVLCLLAYLTITDYRPDSIEALPLEGESSQKAPSVGESITVTTFNTGYSSLSETESFFMDGGEKVRPDSPELVEQNMAGILDFVKSQDSDVFFLQEVDRDSHRSYGIDQFDYYIENSDGLAGAFAINYKCGFVPYPVPFIGRVESGVATFSSLPIEEPQRIALPSPFSWPMSTANLKRCALVSRVPLEGSDSELVLVNIHLDAYDDGSGRIQQTLETLDFAYGEYEKGNYVIIGGDFNQQFPAHPLELVEEGLWEPQSLGDYDIKEGWAFYDGGDTPTCRLLNKPLDPSDGNTQFYIIDGFIISPNLKLESIETINLNFKNSDHNPVTMTVTLSKK